MKRIYVPAAYLGFLVYFLYVLVRFFATSPVDDAVISLTYAQNFLDGNGLVYNIGEHVEGYTNFLWVILSALLLSTGIDGVLGMQILGASLLIATIPLLAFVALRINTYSDFENSKLPSHLFIAFMPFALVPFVRISVSGLETPLFYFLMVAFPTACFLIKKGAAQYILINATALFLFLTRMDGALAIIVCGSVYVAYLCFFDVTVPSKPISVCIKEVLLSFAPAAALALLFVSFKLHYYGNIFPNSYFAKLGYATHWESGVYYFIEFFQLHQYVFLILAPLVLLPLLTSFRNIVIGTSGRVDFFFISSTITIITYCLYILKVGGDFMEFRFAYHILPLAFINVWYCWSRIGSKNWASILAPLAVLLVLASVRIGDAETRNKHLQSSDEMNRYYKSGRSIGEMLRNVLPADTVISTSLAGTMKYYSQLEVIDMWGLNDYFIAHMKNPTQRIRGHFKYAPDSYLRERKVALDFAHPQTTSWERPKRTDFPTVYIRLEGDSCVRARLISPSKNLIALFRSKPDRFKLARVPDYF